MTPKRRNLISLIFIVNCISKCSLIRYNISFKNELFRFVETEANIIL